MLQVYSAYNCLLLWKENICDINHIHICPMDASVKTYMNLIPNMLNTISTHASTPSTEQCLFFSKIFGTQMGCIAQWKTAYCLNRGYTSVQYMHTSPWWTKEGYSMHIHFHVPSFSLLLLPVFNHQEAYRGLLTEYLGGMPDWKARTTFSTLLLLN